MNPATSSCSRLPNRGQFARKGLRNLKDRYAVLVEWNLTFVLLHRCDSDRALRQDEARAAYRRVEQGAWTVALASDGINFIKRQTIARLSAVGGRLDRSLNEDVIRLAVTGLSRAGKTVFITSLIQNLLALGDGGDTLPAVSRRLQADSAFRLKGVRVVSPDTSILPWFDYYSKLRQLASAHPDWPRPTDNLAEISLLLDIERRQSFGRVSLGRRRVRLDILDYPGEWLLDLPLLKQTYQQWSRQTLQLLEQEPRRTAAADFLMYTKSNLKPGDRMQDELVRRGHSLYKDVMETCRALHGLRYLQPGRFICPGPEGVDLPFLWFFPMDVPNGKPKPGSIAEQLIRRFERYKSHVAERFFTPHFANFNRQVMLVDVLGSLYAGRVAFEDTARAIGDVARGLAAQKISRLAVVATKADHVPELTRDNLRSLVQVLAKDAAVAQSAAAVGFFAAASINSTQEGTSQLEGNDVPVVKGFVDGKLRPFYVGQVPSIWPPENFWNHSFFRLPNFQPRPYDPSKGRIEHLGLDLVLDHVIGDLL